MNIKAKAPIIVGKGEAVCGNSAEYLCCFRYLIR